MDFVKLVLYRPNWIQDLFAVLDLAFQPDGSADPLYHQLASHLRGLIEAGRLRSGERLPPSRDLASSLGLSRNTVNRAYESLCGVGLLDAQVGRGTFVSRTLAPSTMKTQKTALNRFADRGPSPTR